MVPEEVFAVLLLTALLTTLVGTCLYVTRLAVAAGSAAGDGPELLAAEPESHEGALVAHLATGELTRRQYRRAMERVAARDDEHHPLTVPPA